LPSKYKLPEGINFTFETERLLIRPLEEKDREFYISLYTDAKIMRHICEPFTLEQADKAFNATLKAMNKAVETLNAMTMTWIVDDIESTQSFGIMSVDFRNRNINVVKQKLTHAGCCEFGIILMQQSHGKGLPNEAIIGLAKFTLTYFKVARIYCTYNKKNLAVSRFIKKIGFVKPTEIISLNSGTEYQYLPIDWLKNLIN